MLVAHGSRNTAADEVVQEIAAAARAALAVEVRVAYVDVRRPAVAEAVAGLPGGVVLPAFLASGYHVRTDLPAQLAAACAGPGFVVAPALGPDPLLAAAALARLAEAGGQPQDELVLAAAGSSDPHALAEVRRAGDQLAEAAARAAAGANGSSAEVVGPAPAAGGASAEVVRPAPDEGGQGSRSRSRAVRVAFAATAAPRIEDLLARPPGGGRRRAVASWLLAPGVFHDRIRRAGEAAGAIVAEPLGAHPHVIDAAVARYHAASGTLPAAA